MCTRFYLETSPELRPFVEQANRAPLKGSMIAKLGRPLKTDGEILPTDIVPVVAPHVRTHAPAVFPMVWGFTHPKGGSPLVNARVETASEKPFWKDAWASHRCVVPASWYYEWEHLTGSDGTKKAGQKYMIQPKGYRLSYLAGLYAIEERNGVKMPVFTVLTREPDESVAFIHDRMPVILPGDAVREWIRPDGRPEDVLVKALSEMYFEKA